MAFVKDDEAVKAGAAEGQQLVQARAALAALARDEARVGAEDDALAAGQAVGHGLVVADAAQVDHGDVAGANVVKVALGVKVQVGAGAEPDGLAAPADKVLKDHARNLAALAHARTVAQQEAAALCAGQHGVVAHRRVDHGLELQRRQQAHVDRLLRQRQLVVRVRRLGRRQRRRLHHWLMNGVSEAQR